MAVVFLNLYFVYILGCSVFEAVCQLQVLIKKVVSEQ